MFTSFYDVQHHHSQELDVEVASMLEMAENPPTANTHPHQEVHTVEVLPGQPATARGGARRDSPPPVSRNIPSRVRLQSFRPHTVYIRKIHHGIYTM